MAGKNSIDLGDPIPQEFLRLTGEIALEWAKLDFVLRAACKRIENVGWKSDRGNEILEMRSHGLVIKSIRQHLTKSPQTNSASEIRNLIDTVGCGRHEKLYGRRNEIIHALFWNSPDGKTIRQRVGYDGAGVTEADVSDMMKLIEELRATWQSLLDLTHSLVSENSPPEMTRSTSVSAPPSAKPLGHKYKE